MFLPDEWTRLINESNADSPWSGAGHTGGYAGGSPNKNSGQGGLGTGGQGSGGSNNQGGRQGGKGNYGGGSNGRDVDKGQMRFVHPERYGAQGGVNNDVHREIKMGLGHALSVSAKGRLDWKRMYSCCNKRYADLVKWQGYQYGICHRFEAGYCGMEKCDAAHLAAAELPNGYPRVLMQDIGPGLKEYASAGHFGGANKRGNEGNRGGPTPKKPKKEPGTGGDEGADGGDRGRG